MNDNQQKLDRRVLAEAAEHLRTAIDLLDRSGAGGHIAAHADLALGLAERLIAAGPKQHSRRPGLDTGNSGFAVRTESD